MTDGVLDSVLIKQKAFSSGSLQVNCPRLRVSTYSDDFKKVAVKDIYNNVIVYYLCLFMPYSDAKDPHAGDQLRENC